MGMEWICFIFLRRCPFNAHDTGEAACKGLQRMCPIPISPQAGVTHWMTMSRWEPSLTYKRWVWKSLQPARWNVPLVKVQSLSFAVFTASRNLFMYNSRDHCKKKSKVLWDSLVFLDYVPPICCYRDMKMRWRSRSPGM